jgi:hypothetical protein
MLNQFEEGSSSPPLPQPTAGLPASGPYKSDQPRQAWGWLGNGADRVSGVSAAYSDHVTSAPPRPSRFFTPGHNTRIRQIAKIAADKGRRMKTE